jgi:hypothetical protein
VESAKVSRICYEVALNFFSCRKLRKVMGVWLKILFCIRDILGPIFSPGFDIAKGCFRGFSIPNRQT